MGENRSRWHRVGVGWRLMDRPTRVQVHAADTGVSVTLNGTDVAAFSWVEGLDVQQWAENYAAAMRVVADG
jgi:hypothetical protein